MTGLLFVYCVGEPHSSLSTRITMCSLLIFLDYRYLLVSDTKQMMIPRSRPMATKHSQRTFYFYSSVARKPIMFTRVLNSEVCPASMFWSQVTSFLHDVFLSVCIFSVHFRVIISIIMKHKDKFCATCTD